jgi:hypothetical protein
VEIPLHPRKCIKAAWETRAEAWLVAGLEMGDSEVQLRFGLQVALSICFRRQFLDQFFIVRRPMPHVEVLDASYAFLWPELETLLSGLN